MNRLEFKVRVFDADRAISEPCGDFSSEEAFSNIGFSQVKVLVDGKDIMDKNRVGIDAVRIFSQENMAGKLILGICSCGEERCDDFCVDVTSDKKYVIWENKSHDIYYTFDLDDYEFEFKALKEKYLEEINGLIWKRQLQVNDIAHDMLEGTVYDMDYRFEYAVASVEEKCIKICYLINSDEQKIFRIDWDCSKVREEEIQTKINAFIQGVLMDNILLEVRAFKIFIDFLYSPDLVCKRKECLRSILSTVIHCETLNEKIVALFYNKHLPLAEDEYCYERLRKEFFPKEIVYTLYDLRDDYYYVSEELGLESKIRSISNPLALKIMLYGDIFPNDKDNINAAIDKFLDSFDCDKLPSEKVISAMQKALFIYTEDAKIAALNYND